MLCGKSREGIYIYIYTCIPDSLCCTVEKTQHCEANIF